MSKVTFKQGPRHMILVAAWTHWKEHLKTCEECSTAWEIAKETPDPTRSAWLVGFSACMDMVQANQLKPVEGAGEN